MAIFAGGSLSCWLAPTMNGLIAARFFQGIGAGMAMVVITTIIKDLFDEKNCSRILSTIGMVIALSPMVAPIVGGKMADLWGWKSCFFVIALIAVTLWGTTIASLRESLNKEHQTRFSFRLLIQTYGQLFKCWKILGFSLISALTFGGLWAWIVEAPFYMINHLGVKSVDYGYYAAIGPGAYVFGTLLNRRYVLVYGVMRLLIWGLGIMIIGAAAALWAAFLSSDSLAALYLAFSIYAIGLAPVFANSTTKAIAVAPSQRGAASALLTALEMGISSLCVLIAGFFSNGTMVPCVALMLGGSVLCAAMVFGITGISRNTKQTVPVSKG
jgi:DHA1 family bicyclomycin/chloramphenicol resistance-like MFS transporter